MSDYTWKGYPKWKTCARCGVTSPRVVEAPDLGAPPVCSDREACTRHGYGMPFSATARTFITQPRAEVEPPPLTDLGRVVIEPLEFPQTDDDIAATFEPRGCRDHLDCDAADRRADEENATRPKHCHDPDCAEHPEGPR